MVDLTEIREVVRSSLNWLATFLMEKYGMNAAEARRTIREMLDVSV